MGKSQTLSLDTPQWVRNLYMKVKTGILRREVFIARVS